MRVRLAIAVCCFLPAAYQVMRGDGRSRWVAGANLAVLAFAIVAERWAIRHSHSPVALAFFRGRPISLSDASLSALTFLAIYLLVVTFAIRFNRLEDPVFLTISFFAIFLGLMALFGTIILAIQRLRARSRAS